MRPWSPLWNGDQSLASQKYKKLASVQIDQANIEKAVQ